MFEDIKVGDLVLVPFPVKWGWNGGKSFVVGRPVTKVTPKRFTVGDTVYNKSKGAIVGDSWRHAKPYDPALCQLKARTAYYQLVKGTLDLDDAVEKLSRMSRDNMIRRGVLITKTLTDMINEYINEEDDNEAI